MVSRGFYVCDLYSVSGDMFLNKLDGGVGMNIMRDIQGDGAITSTNIDLMYAYTFRLRKNWVGKSSFAWLLSKALELGFCLPEMIHPLYGVIYNNNETALQNRMGRMNSDFFDFSAGMIGYNENYYFGLAVHHLTEPVESFRDNSDAVLPRKYTMHFGTKIPIQSPTMKKGDLYLSPNILIQQQQDFQQLTYGMFANHRSFIIGLWFRQNLNFHYDSFIMMMGYFLKDVSFLYSYDLTVSKLRNQTLGAHEVTCIFRLKCFKKPPKYQQVPCQFD